MCVNNTDLNNASPKDPYPLPSIDGFLSFMDAYLGYNQILVHPLDEEKTAFITPMANYCYKVMLFGLRNAKATYQRVMNKVFLEHIGNLMEVYIDNKLVKTKDENSLLSDLEVVFSCLRRHNMRLNP